MLPRIPTLRFLALASLIALSASGCQPGEEGDSCTEDADCAPELVCEPILCTVGPCPATCEVPAPG